jgi:hypothetical protein
MSEMVELVAKALCDDDDSGILSIETCRHMARVAIEAMREPTPDILAAGPGDPYMDSEVWSKMIDAALK